MAKEHIVSEIRWYNIHRSTEAELTGLAQWLAPKLGGWINYYGAIRQTALWEIFSLLNKRLVRWYTNKYKKYRRRVLKAQMKLREICKDYPNLFVHWQYGYTP